MNKYTISKEELLRLLEENPTIENIRLVLLQEDIPSTIKIITMNKGKEFMGDITTTFEEGKAPHYNSKGELLNPNEIVGHDTLVLFCEKENL